MSEIAAFELHTGLLGTPQTKLAYAHDVQDVFDKDLSVNRVKTLFVLVMADIFFGGAQFDMAVDMLKPRAKTLIEYREAAEFITASRPIVIEEKASKGVSGSAKEVLTSIIELLKGYSGDWTAEAIEPMIVKFVEEKGLKLGQVAQPLRAALTGSTASPGIYEVMWVIGKETCIGR